jgi:acylphosphatase
MLGFRVQGIGYRKGTKNESEKSKPWFRGLEAEN